MVAASIYIIFLSLLVISIKNSENIFNDASGLFHFGTSPDDLKPYENTKLK